MFTVLLARLKKLEGLLIFLGILTAGIAAVSFINATDSRSVSNEESLKQLEIKVDNIESELNQLRSIDQRTISMQGDLQLIKEHLIKKSK